MENWWNLRYRNLDSQNVRSVLKMSYAGCSGPFLAISVQFTLKLCDRAENIKNSLKTPTLKVQGHSRSSTLAPVKNLSLLHVIISSLFVPICNRFHSTSQ